VLAHSSDSLLSSYDFVLPEALIAQEPARVRDGSRLLVAPQRGGPWTDSRFDEIGTLLEPGDLLVVNDTRVLPARLTCRRRTGGGVRLLALQPDGAGWRCMVKPSARISEGEQVQIIRRGTDDRGPDITIGPRDASGARLVTCDHDLMTVMKEWGEMPLPPYIDRSDGPDIADDARYQTVFATHDGAVAAPTAGLHFTEAILGELEGRGVGHASVTLHVGAGTFAPVRVDALDGHAMHEERYAVPAVTARRVQDTLEAGSRVVCVGTTSARALESWHRAGRPTDGAMRRTCLFLRPGDPPQLPFGLLTNFHLPKSTLLVLVASLLGRERTLALYEHAVCERYRFFSYGDACLFL